jgi:hypothetical protein
MTDVTERRDRLAAMRGEIAALVANVNAAIEAIEGIPVGAKPVTRSALPHDGEVPGLTLYAEAGVVAMVELDPVGDVALASRLIEAALPRVRST